MGRAFRAIAAVGLVLGLIGCEQEGQSNLTVERLPDVNPQLPEVPKLPPPPHPIQYEDNSYSVFGLRKKMKDTIDSEVEVTGYIVEIYEPPECPEGEKCEVKAPHMWIADTEGESDAEKRLMVVGYAENQKEIDEAVEKAERGQYEPPDPESGILPIPTDFEVGNEVKVKGQFAHVSGSGFMSADGVLDYRGHETLESADGE
ncbi:MAG: hypothetical protein ACOC97_05240 [Myxococcota bacterium]